MLEAFMDGVDDAVADFISSSHDGHDDLMRVMVEAADPTGDLGLAELLRDVEMASRYAFQAALLESLNPTDLIRTALEMVRDGSTVERDDAEWRELVEMCVAYVQSVIMAMGRPEVVAGVIWALLIFVLDRMTSQ
jgi:hypothetical protein